MGSGVDSLVGDEDLPAVHDLCQRDGAVLLPVLDGLLGVDEDDKVVLLALVVDLGLNSLAAGSHCDVVEIWSVCVGECSCRGVEQCLFFVADVWCGQFGGMGRGFVAQH